MTDISTSVFFGNTAGVWSLCPDAPTILVNNTFHANGVGVRYTTIATGNNDHVLRNNIFTNHTNTAVVCNAASWATRDFHMLNGNAATGCINADASVLTSNPLYVAAGSGDFRLGFDSPAKDSGGSTPRDLNGPAAGSFTGTAPDRGARETW